MFQKDHVKRKLAPYQTNCAPVRKRITDEELMKQDPSIRHKILRSVARPNYCETSKRPRRSYYLDSESFDESMCLELEAASEQNRGYGTRSKDVAGNEKSTDKMALTDSDEVFSAKDEDVSNHSVDLDFKSKKGLNKSSSKKGTPTKNHESVKTEHNNVLKNNGECEKQVCPICQEMLPDNHAFTVHIREHNASSNKQSHVCQICQKKLSSASSLDRHMYVHSGERPFQCKICSLAFTTNGNMHRHMRTHSTNKRKLTYSGSEKSEDEEIVVPLKKVYRTSDDSNSQTFKCPVCNKRFISTESLQGHMKNHPNDAIECWKCNMVSENYTAHKNHICLKLEAIKVENADSKVENECVVGFRDLNFIEFSADKFSLIAKNACEEQARCPSSASLAFECHVCGKAFPCTRTLEQHETIHDNKEITFCDDCSNISPKKCAHWLKQRSTDINEEVMTNETLKPDKDSFLATLDLQKVTIKSNSKSLQSFPKEHEVNETQKSVYNDVSASDREISTINFKQNCLTENDFADIPSIISLTSKTTLPNMRTSPVTATPASPENGAMGQNPESPVIEGSANSNFEGFLSENASSSKDPDMQDDSNNQDERFQCRQCSLSFGTMKALRGHVRSHTQNGPHCCDFCPYKSVDKSTLLRHMRTHNGERPFKCSLCDYAFTTKANSHRHVKKKHKLRDDQVSSAVVYNPNMLDTSTSENVSNDNSGETVCKYCKVDFKFSRVLRHHLRSVNNSCNRKPFICRNCSLGFSTKNNCIRHINQQHPEFKDNVHDLIVFNQPQPDSSNECKQTTALASNETSTEEDEPSNLYIVDLEGNNNVNEQIDFQQCLEEQNNCQADIHDQNLTQNMREQVDPQESEQECMSQHLSYNAAHDHHNSCSSEDDRVSIAQSLVSLSEGVMFQVAPLDLSVRAIDLSSRSAHPKTQDTSIKSNSENSSLTSFNGVKEEFVIPQPAHSSPITRSLDEENQLNASVSPINLIQNQSNNVTCQLPSVAALPLIYVPQTISSASVLNSYSNGNLYISNSTCLPASNDAAKAQNACMSQMKMVKKKLVSNERSYKCEYCDGRFTLKSNRERHVKKQHPEFARPARSRNFIPFLPEVEVLKQAQNVSDTTKNLLRSVLIPKVSNNSSNTKPSEDVEDSISVKNENIPTTSNEMIQLEERKDFLDQNVKNDFENNDLASVSSVIDTANSQVIKKYLTGVNFSDSHSSPEKVPSSSESEMEDSKFGRISTEKNREPLMCEYCNRTFPWISALNRHLRTHTGAKPYSCLDCPVNFSTKSNLDRHIKKKCCDKINFRYKSFNGHQNGHGPNLNSQDLKNGFEPQLSLESLMNASKMNSQNAYKPISHKINDTSSNNLKKPSTTTRFNASLNTVAHVASLQLQSLDSTQAELECKFCQNTYKTDDDLTNHMKELHPLEYQSLIGRTMDQTKHTMIPWKKNFSTKKKEIFDKSESFKIKDFSPLPTVTGEPKFADMSSNNKSDSDTGNNLIMNLLGVKDSKVIDEIIDCAARTRMEQGS